MTEIETKWSERVREWKASGQTAKEYAAGREFKASTLVYWASCLRKGVGSAGRPRKQVRMVRVVARSSPTDDAIVIAIGASRVAVRAGFDTGLLRQVVKALEDAR